MFTVDQVVAEHYPALNRRPRFASGVKYLLRHLLREQAFIDFAERYPHLSGIDLVEQVLDYFNFGCTVSDRDRENIPASGKVVVIANHPIGSLDGLALLKLMHEVRSDVKIVANDLLLAIEPLSSLLLPVRNMGGLSRKQQVRKLNQTLEEGAAVIVFPAGEVSRLKPDGIKDGPWQAGFLKLAERAKAPILPIHIDGRNSALFYLASIVAKPLSTVLLVDQMFRQQRKQIHLKIGPLIPYRAYSELRIRRKDKVKLFRKHLYRLGRGKAPLFETESAIARPERKSELREAVRSGTLIGRTPDEMQIFHFRHLDSSPVLREIGRLRELTFRAVGEGTGQRRDVDRFDHYYQHLILWDENRLEIAGAYRFVDAHQTVAARGVEGLYSGSLFRLEPHCCRFLEQGLELGRSFVQQRFWGKRSLDYLWYGIGAFLVGNPHYRYLFGPVSISSAMPPLAKELLVYFYRLYFAGGTQVSCSLNPFVFSQPETALKSAFTGTDYREDFKRLKSLLANLGTAVPPLYKQYTELCEPGGVAFLDFNVDPAFNNCVDGLVIVDIHKLKSKKRQRYMEESILTGTAT